MTTDEPAVPGVSVDGLVSAPGTEVVPVSPPEPPARPDRAEIARRADEELRAGLPPLRRDARVGKPARHPEWMVNQLPVGMVQSDFFVRFVSIFQELGGSLLDGADNLEHLPDLTVTPAPMISALAAWIGAEVVDASLPEDTQRVLLARSGQTMAHRGTPRGLQEYLEMLSDGEATVVDGGGIWAEGEAPDDAAWVRMAVSGTGHLSEDEFVRMVRHQVPAHVRAELWIGSRRVLATGDPAPLVSQEKP